MITLIKGNFNTIIDLCLDIDKYYDDSLGSYTYRTQGDNNNVADSVLVPNKNILGKVILKVPKLGYIQDILSSKGGLIFGVLIPCLAILSYDIVKLCKRIATKKKSKSTVVRR